MSNVLKEDVLYKEFDKMPGYIIGIDGTLYCIKYKCFMRVKIPTDNGESTWRIRHKRMGIINGRSRTDYYIKEEMIRHFKNIDKPIVPLIKRKDDDKGNNHIDNFIYEPTTLDYFRYDKNITFWAMRKDKIIILPDLVNMTYIYDLLNKNYILYRNARIIYKGELVEFNNYIVDSNGGIYTLRSGNYMKPRIGTHGYNVIDFGKGKILVHRLLASTFIDTFDLTYTVDHMDENKLNNHLINLRWLSRGDNTKSWYNNNTYEALAKIRKMRDIKSYRFLPI